MSESVSSLPAGVVREAEAEAEAAGHVTVVCSTRPLPRVVDVFERCRRRLVLLSPEELADRVEQFTAPPAVLVDAPQLGSCTERVLAGLRDRFPAMRACLLADRTTSATALLTALRSGIADVADPDDPGSVSRLASRLVATGNGPHAERILAVGAHPDDVEIGCGGTLLRHRSHGCPVTVLTLSRGGVGGPRQVRRREAVAAATAMDAGLLMADLPDTRLEHADELVGLVEGVVEAVRPTTVYVHSGSDGHQDHRAVHDATAIAARRVISVLCYQSPSSRNGFSPTKFVPVDTTLEAKVGLLQHYRTQQTRHYLEPGLVVATARYWARQLPHASYAEPFEVLRASEPT